MQKLYISHYKAYESQARNTVVAASGFNKASVHFTTWPGLVRPGSDIFCPEWGMTPSRWETVAVAYDVQMAVGPTGAADSVLARRHSTSIVTRNQVPPPLPTHTVC